MNNKQKYALTNNKENKKLTANFGF